MSCVRELAILFLFLNALHAHCRIVFKTQNITEADSLLTLKKGEPHACDCGPGGTCSFDNDQKNCDCHLGFALKNENCEECDCGVYGVCHFQDGRKKCTCVRSTAELNGKCVECNCGLDLASCFFERNGTKICFCGSKYIDVNGHCTECDCGLYGFCRFEFGQKKCLCSPGFIESDGKCVANKTSTTVTTEPSSLTTRILTSTVSSCDCGIGGTCHLDSSGEKICNCFSGYSLYEGHCYDCNCGEYSKSCRYSWIKICDCFPGYVENHGTCEECDCGKNARSCRFDGNGDKRCNCTSGYAQTSGICEDCKCGVNARSCFFRDNGIKVCNCDFGYNQTNGYCSAICNEDKCIHGTCEVIGNGFQCRCNEGFTGQRCEEKNKQNFWMVLELSGLFAIVILLSCMFCVWTPILNKMSKK